MAKIFRFLLPPLVLACSLGIAAALLSTAPESQRKRPETPIPTVEVLTLTSQDYQVLIPSQGTISAKTSGQLVAEVSGKLVNVSPNFENGGFFKNGETLAQIDQRDYQNAVTMAKAQVSLKQAALAEEQARSEQARRDWDKLKLADQPTALALREPQLEHAKADLAAAEAQLTQARLELDRTRISAPYAGRILEKSAAIGQYISAGTPLASIFASDALEVRLPLTNDQLRYLQLPEHFADDKETAKPAVPVSLKAQIGGQEYIWQAQLVRTESSIDIDSRQLFVIAQIDNPYQRQTHRPQLKIGQFVEAEINGNVLTDVFVIPRTAVHGQNIVHVITPDNLLQRRELEIIWRDRHNLIASGPLTAGENISLTTLPFAADGIKVEIAEQKSPQAGEQNAQ